MSFEWSTLGFDKIYAISPFVMRKLYADKTGNDVKLEPTWEALTLPEMLTLYWLMIWCWHYHHNYHGSPVNLIEWQPLEEIYLGTTGIFCAFPKYWPTPSHLKPGRKIDQRRYYLLRILYTKSGILPKSGHYLPNYIISRDSETSSYSGQTSHVAIGPSPPLPHRSPNGGDNRNVGTLSIFFPVSYIEPNTASVSSRR